MSVNENSQNLLCTNLNYVKNKHNLIKNSKLLKLKRNTNAIKKNESQTSS